MLQRVNTGVARCRSPNRNRPSVFIRAPGGCMPVTRSLRLAISVSTIALAACNPFQRDPVTEVTRDVNANLRWRASLVTPASLAGAVQINGTATMQPGSTGETTDISLHVANATPG